MEEAVKQELELFFDTNKDKNLDELKKELKEKIFIDKRIDKIIYLIKLFKDERQETIKLLKENDNSEIREYISNLNNIIDYLNQNINSLKNKQNSKQKNNISKRKKYRQQNIEIIFDSEILNLVEEFERNYNFLNLNYESIINLIRYYNNKKLNLIYQNNNSDMQIETEIIEINSVLEQLIIYKNKFLNTISQNKTKNISPSKTKKTTNNKVDKRKNKNDEIIVSDETMQLIENGFDVEILELNTIVELIKHYQTKKDNLINLKLIAQKNQESEKLDSIYYQIRNCNNLLERLIAKKKEKMEIENKKTKEINNRKKFILPISLNQVREIDEYFGVNTIDLINSIISDDNIDEDKLNQIYITYEDCKKQIFKDKMNLISKKRELKKHKSENNILIEEINGVIEKINIHMDILNNLLNYLKPYQIHTPSLGKVVFEDEIEIDSTQEIIKKEILLGKDINGYELKDKLFAIGHYIKHDETIDKNILQYAREIFNECLSITIEDEQILKGMYYIWDCIKYRLSNIPKEEIETRKILKDIRILFDIVLGNYKVDNQKFKHDYLFDIVDYFLKSEDNYLYLKKIINKMPNIINATHIITENGKKQYEHVIVYIVKKYISNYRKMLKNKKSDYVNLDYLKSVYFLFTRNYMMYLTEEEKKQIDNLLANFMHEVNIYLTSSRRQNAVKMDLKDMHTDKFYMNNKRFILEDISESRLETQMNNFQIAMNTSINRKNRVDLTEEYSFFIGGSPNAYTVEKTEEGIVLKIHVLDLYDLIVRNSELEKYLYNQTLKNDDLDDFLTRQINMSKNRIYPTITYEITFDEKGNYKRKNGHIDKFKIYLSKIQPKAYLSDFNLQYRRGGILLKSITDLYRISVIKNHGNYSGNYCMHDIQNYFEQILNQGITEYFKFNNLPFIYSGIKEHSEQEFIHIMNNISHILSRLDTEEFHAIRDIVSNNVDEFHYSINEFNGEYQLSIQNPLNYVGLSIQRILHELVLENKHSEEEYKIALDKFKKEFKELIMYLNYYNSYVDKDILKQNRGKIKEKEKILF